jgi:agmatine deiminase
MTVPPGLRGYAMPPEWTEHRATWIAWPHHRGDWPGRFEPIPWVYAEIVRILGRNEQVEILVQDAAAQRQAKGVLGKVGIDSKKVRFHRIPTDRVWTRDSGAIFVRNPAGKKIATHWTFNGWAKYSNHKRDGAVAGRIAKAVRVPEYRVDAVDVDGAGTLLATEECLLSDVQARNPKLGREGTERVLRETLGVRRIVWLGKGIAGDDTHGHVDDLARFVAPGHVFLCEEKNAKDENYRPLQENRERLHQARLRVIPLPMPAPVVFEGQRLPASYANFYIANGVVIVPTFNDPQDRRALGIIADCFPGREVVGIHCLDFVWGLGTLHCATQQEPA